METTNDSKRKRGPLWTCLIGLGLLALLHIPQLLQGKLLVDMQTYYQGKERIEAGKPLYLSVAESQAHWRKLHLFALKKTKVKDQNASYNYLPSLALWLTRLHIPPLLFFLFLCGSFIAALWFWEPYIPAQHIPWLGLGAFSWDAIASCFGGNIELVLLCGSLFACWLLWEERALLAGGLIALIMLVKPFYGMLFATFGLHWMCQSRQWQRRWWVLLQAAIIAITLIAIDVALWGPGLRAQALAYYSQALAHQWLGLPPDQQIPMSIWNRSLLQGFVSAGFAAATARNIVLVLWLVVLAISTWRSRGMHHSFPWVFAISIVIYYMCKPVSWTFPLLELLILTAIWPLLRTPKEAFAWWAFGHLIFLMHWAAMLWSIATKGVGLFTFQSASFPWETWTLLPGTWLIFMLLARRPPQENPPQENHPQEHLSPAPS